MVECDFDVVSEYIEQMDGIAVFITGLFRGFSIDGGGEFSVLFGKQDVEKLGEGILEFLESGFRQYSGDGGIDGRLVSGESEWFFEGAPIACCPALDVGDVGQSGEESEKDEDEYAVIIVSDAARIAGIVCFLKGGQQGIESGTAHGNFRVGKNNGARRCSRNPTTFQMTDCWENSQKFKLCRSSGTIDE